MSIVCLCVLMLVFVILSVEVFLSLFLSLYHIINVLNRYRRNGLRKYIAMASGGWASERAKEYPLPPVGMLWMYM